MKLDFASFPYLRVCLYIAVEEETWVPSSGALDFPPGRWENLPRKWALHNQNLGDFFAAPNKEFWRLVSTPFPGKRALHKQTLIDNYIHDPMDWSCGLEARHRKDSMIHELLKNQHSKNSLFLSNGCYTGYGACKKLDDTSTKRCMLGLHCIKLGSCLFSAKLIRSSRYGEDGKGYK